MTSETEEQDRRKQEGVRVLLVDDSASIVDRLTAQLSRMERVAVVGSAEDSDQAIEAVGRLQPDVIVLDIRLRDSDGWTVLQYSTEFAPATRIFVFSNEQNPELRDRYLEAGADHFFDKSLDFMELKAAIEKLAENNKPV